MQTIAMGMTVHKSPKEAGNNFNSMKSENILLCFSLIGTNEVALKAGWHLTDKD